MIQANASAAEIKIFFSFGSASLLARLKSSLAAFFLASGEMFSISTRMKTVWAVVIRHISSIAALFVWIVSKISVVTESFFHVVAKTMMNVAGGGGNAVACASGFPKTDRENAR